MVKADVWRGRYFTQQVDLPRASLFTPASGEVRDGAELCSDRAQASNNLGNAARDLGDYCICGRSFSASPRALGADRRRRVRGGADVILGKSCDEPGRVPKDVSIISKRWPCARRLGMWIGATLAQANLAILAVEEGDGPAAVSRR